MSHYLTELLSICSEGGVGVRPYILRARFERSVYGLIVQVARTLQQPIPSSLTANYALALRASADTANERLLSDVVTQASGVISKFTTLCDSSNWSTDGQDPRLKICTADALALCTTCSRLLDGPAS